VDDIKVMYILVPNCTVNVNMLMVLYSVAYVN